MWQLCFTCYRRTVHFCFVEPLLSMEGTGKSKEHYNAISVHLTLKCDSLLIVHSKANTVTSK
jgi:hypothetical protein